MGSDGTDGVGMAGGWVLGATIAAAMGQSIVVNEKPSSIPGVVRFETNRALTGMGHERYVAGTEVWGERPPDELARRLFERPSVAGVQINGNIVTVDLAKGYDADGLLEIIENLYRFYPDPVPTVDETGTVEAAADEPAAEAPADVAEDAADEPAEAPAAEGPADDAEGSASPEVAADPAEVTDEVADDAPAPEHEAPEAADEPASDADA